MPEAGWLRVPPVHTMAILRARDESRVAITEGEAEWQNERRRTDGSDLPRHEQRGESVRTLEAVRGERATNPLFHMK